MGKVIKPKEESTISNPFNRTFKLSFLAQEKNLWYLYWPKEKKLQLEDLNKEGEAAETGNVLLPSTHLSIQMSTPLREHHHVNMKCSGHDPLEAHETDSMGNQLQYSRTTARLSKGHLL